MKSKSIINCAVSRQLLNWDGHWSRLSVHSIVVCKSNMLTPNLSVSLYLWISSNFKWSWIVINTSATWPCLFMPVQECSQKSSAERERQLWAVFTLFFTEKAWCLWELQWVRDISRLLCLAFRIPVTSLRFSSGEKHSKWCTSVFSSLSLARP